MMKWQSFCIALLSSAVAVADVDAVGLLQRAVDVSQPASNQSRAVQLLSRTSFLVHMVDEALQVQKAQTNDDPYPPLKQFGLCMLGHGFPGVDAVLGIIDAIAAMKRNCQTGCFSDIMDLMGGVLGLVHNLADVPQVCFTNPTDCEDSKFLKDIAPGVLALRGLEAATTALSAGALVKNDCVGQNGGDIAGATDFGIPVLLYPILKSLPFLNDVATFGFFWKEESEKKTQEYGYSLCETGFGALHTILDITQEALAVQMHNSGSWGEACSGAIIQAVRVIPQLIVAACGYKSCVLGEDRSSSYGAGSSPP